MNEIISFSITAMFFVVPAALIFFISIRFPTFFGRRVTQREKTMPACLFACGLIVGNVWLARLDSLKKITPMTEQWIEVARHTPFRGTKEVPISATIMYDRTLGFIEYIGTTADKQTWNQEYRSSFEKLHIKRHSEPYILVLKNRAYFHQRRWLLGSPVVNGSIRVYIPEDMIISNK